MTDGNGKPKRTIPSSKKKPKVKKEGWRNASKELQSVVFPEGKFIGVAFLMNGVPLRKIGIEPTAIIMQGKPVRNVVNATHNQAPEYRIIITNKGLELYVRGMPPILLQ